MAKANERFSLVWSSSRSDRMITPETAKGIGAPATVSNEPVSSIVEGCLISGCYSLTSNAQIINAQSAANNKKSMLQSLASLRLSTAIALMFAGVAPSVVAQALQDPTVHSGTATIDLSNANHAVITQQSNKAIIDWRQFSIPSGSTVQFVQPSASSMVLNRVTGTQASQIDGNLLANGQVWLLNPSGVMIGNGGSINTASFLASTLDINNNDFINGRYRFDATSNSTGRVVNAGTIKSAENGYVVLSGKQINNEGVIEAKLGSVLLGSGQAMTLDLVGDKLLSFAINTPVATLPTDGKANIENSGRITAQGGKVMMTARTATDVMHSVINVSGVVDATSVRLVNGEIVLDGGSTGSVTVSGSLVATGLQASETGGAIKVFGKDITVANNALLDARGDAGGGVIHVGGGWQGSGLAGRPSALTTQVGSNAVIDASAINKGNGGEIVIWSDIHNKQSITNVSGTLLAKGGTASGNGGRIETSGYLLGTTGIRVNANAPIGLSGEWLLDPFNITISDASGITNAQFEQISGTGSNRNYIAPTDTFILNTTLNDQLNAGTSVSIKASGNISVTNANLNSAAGVLVLHAGQNIDLSDSYITLGSLGLIADNGSIKASGGSITTTLSKINMFGITGSSLNASSIGANSGPNAVGTLPILYGISLFAIAYDSISLLAGISITANDSNGNKVVLIARDNINSVATTTISSQNILAYSDNASFSLNGGYAANLFPSASGKAKSKQSVISAENFEAAVQAFVKANETNRQNGSTVLQGALASIQNQIGQQSLGMQALQKPIQSQPAQQNQQPQPQSKQAAPDGDAPAPNQAPSNQQPAANKPPPKDGAAADAPDGEVAPQPKQAANDPVAPAPAPTAAPRQAANNAPAPAPALAPAPQSVPANNATPAPVAPAAPTQVSLAAPPPPVAPPPPSPVATEKPPTPKDAADSGDKTLAMAAPQPPSKPATQSQATTVRTSVVSPGLVEVQVPVPPRPPSGAAAEQLVPTMGNSSRW
jgi:filamentous hemagglutinin family protein